MIAAVFYQSSIFTNDLWLYNISRTPKKVKKVKAPLDFIEVSDLDCISAVGLGFQSSI